VHARTDASLKEADGQLLPRFGLLFCSASWSASISRSMSGLNSGVNDLT
jgi:hypothetical protein